MLPGLMGIGGFSAAGGAAPAGYPLTDYAAGPTTTASGASADIQTFTVTAAQQTANAKYLVFWSVETWNTNTGASSASLRLNGSQVAVGGHVMKQVSSPQDKHAVGGVYLFDATATPADATFVIRITAAASSTATGQRSRITLLKLGPDDSYTENNSSVVGSGSSPTNVVTHNWTPGSVGDYVIIGWTEAAGNGGSGARAQMTHNSVTTEMPWRSSTRTASHMFLQVRTAVPASAQSALIGVYRGSVGQATTSTRAGIATLRADRFAAVFSNRLGAHSSGTESSYTNGQTLSFTAANAPHLTLIMSGTADSVSTESAYLRGLEDGVEKFEAIKEPSTGGDQYTEIFHDCSVLAAGSRSWTLERKSEAGGGSAFVLTPSTLISIDLTGISVP